MIAPIRALLVAFLLSTINADPCKKIDETFRKTSSENGPVSCKCLIDPLVPEFYQNVWIGCTGQSMSAVFSELGSLNETLVNRIHIWDSQLDIIPAEMFEKVKPKKLIIENSLVNIVRKGTFTVIGPRLQELRLRNNAMKKNLDPEMLTGLDHLQILDLSGNKLTKIRSADFEKVAELEELLLNENGIGEIEEGSFENLSQLRVLSIQNNQITAITKNTFKGLENLEELYLQNNQISSIDWTAFRNLKKLKILDLGRNHISSVDLQGFDKLEKLILNNNSIQTLKNVVLRSLPSLVYISFDRNTIAEIEDDSFRGLATSPRLDTVSMASNNITVIGGNAFKHVTSIRSLALQMNQLSSLSSNGLAALSPLRHLSVLILSGNRLDALHEGELPKSLRVILLDNNQLAHIDSSTFRGLSIERLHLNSNRLTHLPKGTFDDIDLTVLKQIDITENRWQCVCEEEWLGSWLDKLGESDVGDGTIGCLALACPKVEEESNGSKWVTVVASVLAGVSVLILIAIAYLYIEDVRSRAMIKRPFGRVDSDLARLIEKEAKTDADRGLIRKQKAPEIAQNNKRNVRFVS
ncbi:unnamed protein product, partial [Mesorhabditis belari]|uniref:Uncharacterized protein n=1 Tax=Mesorhabditis belari TaxID=2138241 RepID=A0AAF3ECA1_9BILA